jgi:hypothetical protein
MKDTLISVGLLAAGGVAIAAASGAYSKGSRSGINVNDMTDESRRTYSAGDAHVHVWLDLGVARDDRGNKVPKSGEWQVICSTSPDPLNLSPRGSELERQTFRFADPKQRQLVAMSANDYIRGLLFRHRGKGSAARATLTLDQVQAGDRVTTRNRFNQERTGTAVMRSAHGGWVLNMGGAHGTPGLVDEGNFVRATRPTEKRDASSGRADWLAGEGSRATKERSGVKLRCYGGRAGIQSIDGKCGWSGDSGDATITPSGEERCPKCGGSTIPPLRFAPYYHKGSMTRDGSYEATLMFDADEDDPSVRAQRQLQENPYVPQARPLTAEPQRITSAQEPAGSAARGVTDGYVEDYLNGENIAISTFLSRNLRGKAKSYSGQYARRMTAALEALVASGEVYRDTTPKGAASYRRATSAQGSAARGAYEIRYHRDGSVTFWDVYTQSWTRTDSPSDEQLASLSAAERKRVQRHTGSAARGSSSVLGALTSKPKPPIPGPSLKMLEARLNLGGEEGKSLKHFMQVGQRKAALDYANQLLDGDGIEYIPSEQDTMRSRAGLEFVNMGDTYDTTLIYDFSTGRFYVGAWGDWVERYPKRFG